MIPDDVRAVLSAASAGWHKATASQGSDGCVEVNDTAAPGYVGIRDSKLGDASPVLVTTSAGFQRFLVVATARLS